MTQWLTDGGKLHLPAYIDWRRGQADAECGRDVDRLVEQDEADPDEVCQDCMEARPEYGPVEQDEADGTEG